MTTLIKNKKFKNKNFIFSLNQSNTAPCDLASIYVDSEKLFARLLKTHSVLGTLFEKFVSLLSQMNCCRLTFASFFACEQVLCPSL